MSREGNFSESLEEPAVSPDEISQDLIEAFMKNYRGALEAGVDPDVVGKELNKMVVDALERVRGFGSEYVERLMVSIETELDTQLVPSEKVSAETIGKVKERVEKSLAEYRRG